MSTIQYGVQYSSSKSGNGIVWYKMESQAREEAAEAEDVKLMAREVGEPYEVKTLPTTPGSVIRLHSGVILGLAHWEQWRIVTHPGGPYMTPEQVLAGWTLIHDEGSQPKP